MLFFYLFLLQKTSVGLGLILGSVGLHLRSISGLHQYNIFLPNQQNEGGSISNNKQTNKQQANKQKQRKKKKKKEKTTLNQNDLCPPLK